MSDKKQRVVTSEARKRSLSNYEAYLEFTIMLWRSDLGQRRWILPPKLTISEMAQAIVSEGRSIHETKAPTHMPELR
jgi:hypothetical protein